MKPEDMDEVLRHTTPTVLRVRDHLRPETRALIDKANELLAIWQEQRATSERAWDEHGVAWEAFLALVEGGNASSEELHAALARTKTLREYAKTVPSEREAYREWSAIKAQAITALSADAGLLQSEEEKREEEMRREFERECKEDEVPRKRHKKRGKRNPLHPDPSRLSPEFQETDRIAVLDKTGQRVKGGTP